MRSRARVGAGRAALGLLHEFDCVKFRLYPDSLFHLFGGMIRFGNHSLLTGVWFVAATSLALGNIDIDQAAVSTIADRIAVAKVTLIRMTPTSGSTSLSLIFAPSYRKKCELPHIDGDYLPAARVLIRTPSATTRVAKSVGPVGRPTRLQAERRTRVPTSDRQSSAEDPP